MVCGEEDLDWKVVPIPGKGLGVIAVHDIPAKMRIMVDRVLTEPEARMRREVMDLFPEGETFQKKFKTNQLASVVGPVSWNKYISHLTWLELIVLSFSISNQIGQIRLIFSITIHFTN